MILDVSQVYSFLSYTSDAESGLRSSGASVAAAAGNKKPSNMAQVKDGPGVIKVEGDTKFSPIDCN